MKTTPKIQTVDEVINDLLQRGRVKKILSGRPSYTIYFQDGTESKLASNLADRFLAAYRKTQLS